MTSAQPRAITCIYQLVVAPTVWFQLLFCTPRYATSTSTAGVDVGSVGSGGCGGGRGGTR